MVGRNQVICHSASERVSLPAALPHFAGLEARNNPCVRSGCLLQHAPSDRLKSILDPCCEVLERHCSHRGRFNHLCRFSSVRIITFGWYPAVPIQSGEEDGAQQRRPLVDVRQGMVARHGLQQDRRLRRKLGVPLEVTEAGARCRQRRAGQCVVGDCSDGCQFGPERFGRRSEKSSRVR
jgi:hypothetical protein